MDADALAVEAEVEADHWWFVGRRRLFAREISRLKLPPDARIADIGTGTGSSLRMLRDLGFTQVVGVDSSEEAIRHCAAKGLGKVERGDICNIPLPDSSQDLVIATDIIEHVDDDVRAMREVARVLAPQGAALIAVPTFPSLWGLQDEQAHHKRRYRLRPLLALVESAGLTPRHSYHFNYLLFVPIWLARRIIDVFGLRLKSENEINSPLINRVLTYVFLFDCLTAPVLHMPFGVSALVVARHR